MDLCLIFYDLRSMFSKLYNYYWFIRSARDLSERRRHYRYAAIEKKRLIESGVDCEELRLLCRHLANPRNRFAERSLIAYRDNQKKSNTSPFSLNLRLFDTCHSFPFWEI